MPQAVEKCVRRLVTNPKFKPRNKGQSKESAAFAVCTAIMQDQSSESYVASKHDNLISLAQEVADNNGMIRFDLKNKKPIKAIKGKLPDKIELLRAGTYKHPFLGDLVFDKKRFKDFILSFEARLEAKGPNREENILPVNVNHDRRGPAYGWIDGLETDGEVLFAKIKKWTKLGKEAIKEDLYRYISAELTSESWRDFQTANKEKNVITGAALTNIPYMQVLMPLTNVETSTLNFNQKSKMKIKTILKKDPKELSLEEKKFVRKNSSELSAEDKKRFAIVLSKKTNKKILKLNKKTVTLSASEHAKLQKTSERVDELEQTLRKSGIEKQVDLMVASETNKGRLLPKHKELVVDLLMDMSDEQTEKLEEFIESLPEVNVFGEEGSGESSTLSSSKKIDKLVAKFRKDNPKTSYREGLTAVLAQNKELAKSYEASVATK